MAVLKNRAKMSTSTTGTGTITLGSAESGYQTFADAGVANADVVRYVIEDGNNWEIGTGTYTATGTTLSRTVSESSNADAAINLSGSATVFIGATAEDIPDLYADNYDGTSTAPSATGSNAIALGRNATALGEDCVAIGNDANAQASFGSAGFSMGEQADASAGSLSLGNFSSASGSASTAIGTSAQATSGNASALGNDARGAGSDAVALGKSRAGGTDSFAAQIGSNSSSYGATGNNATAVGVLTKATGLDFVFGRSSIASGGSGSLSLGMDNTSSAGGAVTLGKGNTSSHTDAVVIGQGASSSAADEITLGHTDQTVRISSSYTLPTSDGTNGQVLTTDGAGAVTFAAAGGGGGDPDLYRDNAVNATTPTAAGDNGIAIGSNAVNTTTHGSKNGLAVGTNAVADYWATALGAGTDATGNSSLAVGYNSQATGSKSTAIMNSYASGESSFAAVIDNNTSSYGAGNYSNIAMGANAKATSGGSTVAIGAGTVASGNFAAAVGANCEATNGGSAFGRGSDATGGYSLALGASNLASQFYSVAIGNNAKSEIKGKLAYGSGRFTTNGDVQAGTFILRMASTSATAVTLTSDGSATADTTNQVVLPNNSAYSFSGTIIARQQAAGGSNYASWEIKGALLRDANAASTVLGNGIVNKLYATAGASAWAVALTADTTNGGLKVEVTGAAATNIRWVATVNTSEVTYA